MSGTESPAKRPTPTAVWQAFQNSNKKNLLITGGRKTGKTTLLSNLFPSQTRGITTRAIPGDCVCLRENITGRTACIGEYDPTRGTLENKMRLCREELLSVGIPALEACIASEDPWITVDEIGYLETDCPEYCQQLRTLLDTKRVAAVIRKQNLPFLQELCNRSDVFLLDLDAPFGDLGCVIMASGLGKRFGGNKLMADFGGAPMIERALLATDGIFSKRVVVTRSEEVAEYCRARGTDVILHILPNRNDTVRLGLAAMENVNGCLFCPGDQPLLTEETVASLALLANAEKHCICRPIFEETVGAPVLFPQSTFEELRSLPEGKGGGFVAKQHPDWMKTLRIQNAYELMDADTPDQLDLLRTKIH